MPRKLTTDIFINKAESVHCGSYGYSKTVYVLSNQKVIITCPRHGEFLQNPNNHLNGQGCPHCFGNIRLKTEEFVERSRKKHGNAYTYTKTSYVSSHQNVCITCPNHGDFFQAPSSHLRGFGCPKCACYRISVPETEFLDYLGIPVSNRQVCISQRKVDGCDPQTKTIYEFLGDFWHGNPAKYDPTDMNKFCKKSFGELYRATILKFSQLKSFGYQVKYIWELDWNLFKNGKMSVPTIQSF